MFVKGKSYENITLLELKNVKKCIEENPTNDNCNKITILVEPSDEKTLNNGSQNDISVLLNNSNI